LLEPCDLKPLGRGEVDLVQPHVPGDPEQVPQRELQLSAVFEARFTRAYSRASAAKSSK